MSSNENAHGRKIEHIFKLVYGPDFQAEWSTHTWTDLPSKIVIKPNHGALFVGFVAADGLARRGFLLDADGAISLGHRLQHNGALSKLRRDQQ